MVITMGWYRARARGRARARARARARGGWLELGTRCCNVFMDITRLLPFLTFDGIVVILYSQLF